MGEGVFLGFLAVGVDPVSTTSNFNELLLKVGALLIGRGESTFDDEAVERGEELDSC